MNYSDLLKKYGLDKTIKYDFFTRTFSKTILLDSAQKYVDADKELSNLGNDLEFEDLEKVRKLVYLRMGMKESFFHQANLESFVTRRYDPYERLQLELEIKKQIEESINGFIDF